MEPPQYPKPRPYGTSMKVAIPPLPASSEIDRSSHSNNNGGELRSLDCNRSSLCDHIQIEGFNSAAFSDVIVQVMGSTYHLHRLILSRSSYFRNMLHGPWKEASAPILTLHIDDDNVNGEAIAMALAYLYGHHPKLNDNNAFRVLAAASFLDLQDLCATCTDFIISELWTSNFLAYQVFAEGQDYGIHGERVRSACWGYLCQSGAMELKEVLPKISSQTLQALLISDELWVPTEEKRFELALYTLLAKGAFSKSDTEQGSSTHEMGEGAHSDSTGGRNDKSTDKNTDNQMMKSEMGHLGVKDDREVHKAAHNILVELADCVVDFHSGTADSEPQDKPSCSQLNEGARYAGQRGKAASLTNAFSHPDGSRTSSYVEMLNGVEASRMRGCGVAMEGPSEDSSCYQLNNSIWLPRDQSRQCSSEASSCNGFMPNEWGRCNMPPPPWGGRIVGRRQVKNYAQGNCGIRGEEYNAFINIFEGGSLLYCNMSFDALLNVRKQLEELGFPCKTINDGLWLQMLLSHRVQEVGADTCKSCCLPSIACACRQSYGFSQGAPTTGYYMQEHDRNNPPGNMGNLYGADPAHGEGNGFSRPVRVYVRGPIDGLAGIGRGTTFVHSTAWPPTRFVFSRVPFGLGNRNGQQSPANDESEARADLSGELSGDGLTALVGLTQAGNVHGDQSQRGYDPDQQGRFAGGGNGLHIHGDQSERGYDADLHSRFGGASVSGQSASSIPVQMLESHDHDIGLEWENANESSISLDIKTPLRDFPPFRFGVEFEDVHRLTDGQVKHSQEVFYAGSLWKVSVQAFNDEDPQGRRTLGLFLHRRKAEITEFQRKVYLYIDSREKVTARYQLICPSKREVMVFGSFKQAGTLLPKAPKGWGWRTALLFDELGDLLQGGALRVAAVVQLV